MIRLDLPPLAFPIGLEELRVPDLFQKRPNFLQGEGIEVDSPTVEALGHTLKLALDMPEAVLGHEGAFPQLLERMVVQAADFDLAVYIGAAGIQPAIPADDGGLPEAGAGGAS